MHPWHQLNVKEQCALGKEDFRMVLSMLWRQFKLFWLQKCLTTFSHISRMVQERLVISAWLIKTQLSLADPLVFVSFLCALQVFAHFSFASSDKDLTLRKIWSLTALSYSAAALLCMNDAARNSGHWLCSGHFQFFFFFKSLGLLLVIFSGLRLKGISSNLFSSLKFSINVNKENRDILLILSKHLIRNLSFSFVPTFVVIEANW